MAESGGNSDLSDSFMDNKGDRNQGQPNLPGITYPPTHRHNVQHTEIQYLPIHKAWKRVKLNIRYDSKLEIVQDETSDIPPSKLQFAVESENVKKSMLLRLKKTMTIEKASNEPETVNVEIYKHMTAKEVIHKINSTLRDKVVRQMSFQTEQMFQQFLDTFDDLQKDLLKNGTVGIYFDPTGHDVKVNLIGSEDDVAAMEDMSKPSEATGENKDDYPVPPSRNSGLYFDHQKKVYVDRQVYDIDTIQYLHSMHFKEHLSKHCKNSRCSELDSDNTILEITGRTESDVKAASYILRIFLEKIVKRQISVPAVVLKFFQTENVFLHLQKRLQVVPAYVQVKDIAVVWTDDVGKSERAEREILSCFGYCKVKGRLEKTDDLNTALEQSKGKIKIYEGDCDDELHVIYLNVVSELASKVINLLDEEPETKWFDLTVVFDEYIIKYAMAAKLDSEIRKAFPNVDIKFCIQSRSVKVMAEQEIDIEDVHKELTAHFRRLKKVEIKGLTEGIEQLLLRTHISSYVAKELKQQYLLFLKEGDGIICVGKDLGNGEKLKEEIMKKCFMTTDMKKDFLDLDSGKQFLEKHSDKIYAESQVDKTKSKSRQLCFTRDLEHDVDEFVKKCVLPGNFQKKCNPVTSNFLQTYGSAIVESIGKKNSVKIVFKDGTIIFEGNHDNGKKASQELERNVPTDYLYFKNGERQKNLLESEEGKKSLEDITRTKKCCWSMTCQSVGKIGELEKVSKNGIFNRPATSVLITKQSICEVKAQCLVVAVAKNLDLSRGYLSNMVKKEAGGDVLESEIKTNYANRMLKPGEMITTSPGKLRKKGVNMLIFGHLKKWSNFPQQLQGLQQFVTDCLIKADENDCKSVAFPALGTGNLGYPPRDVAKVMLDEIEKYIAESMSGNLDTVFICSPAEEMHKILSMDQKLRLMPDDTSEGDVESSSGDDDILTANDRRINCTVVNEIQLQRKPLGEYVIVHFLPTEKGEGNDVHLDTWQVDIECGPSVNDLKDAVRRMVCTCEQNFITSVYVYCSTDFRFSFGEQAETIIETVFDISKDEYPSCHYNYLSNVTIVTNDKTGFFNIEERLLKERRSMGWYLSFFGGDVNSRIWRKEARSRPQCSVIVKLIGAEKENVDAAKEAIEKYLLSKSHDQRTNIPEKQSEEVCAEVNPGITKYLDSRQDYYVTWKKEVELVFDIQVVEHRDNDRVKMKIVGSFDSIMDIENYFETNFPDLPKKSQSQEIEFDYLHFTAGKENIVMKIPISEEEKSKLMEMFAEEIQALTREGLIFELSSRDDGINVTCNKDDEAHVKAKFYYFKKKISEVKVRTMQFDSDSELCLAKSVCSEQCPKHTTFVPDTKKKQIKLMGMNPDALDELEMKVYSIVTASSEDGKTDVSKAFSFGVLHVYIYPCDILKADVECIVSATNKILGNARGVSKCIADAAGKQYSKVCADSVKTKGELKLTKCRTTESGQLKFKKIVHVNCMMLKSDRVIWEKLEVIQNSVISCLEEADKLGMKSIALPFICSGASGFQIELCAQQYIRASMTCGKLKCLRQVHFVDKHASSVQDVCKVFEAYFEEQSKPAYAVPGDITIKFKDGGQINICHGKIQLSPAQGITVFTDKSFNEKDIETLKEIQNIDSCNDFEHMFKNLKKKGVQDVSILPFSGRKMFDVILAVLPVWSESKNYERDTRITVKSILSKTDERGLVSLALPLPGKEKDIQVRRLCCKAFCDEILDFFSRRETNLKDVSVYVVDSCDFKEMNSTLEKKIGERQKLGGPEKLTYV